MLNKNNVLIRAKDQQIYHLNQNIKKYSPLVNNILKETENDLGPINLSLSSHQIMLFSQYFAARNFEIPLEFIVKKPLTTHKLKELLLPEDYEILKDWSKEDIKDLLEVSLYLEIEVLSEILLTKIAADYFINIGKNAIEDFRLKTGLNEELSEETIINIKKEFKWAFS